MKFTVNSLQFTKQRGGKAAARAHAHCPLSTVHCKLRQRGITVVLVLVFAAVFGMSVIALTGFIFAQTQLGRSKEVREQALATAEAGLQYYHWFLAHYPNDLEDGTGAPGPYVHTYADPEGDDIGNFSLDIEGNAACGEVQSIDITSTGTVDKDPRFTRTIFGRHARPSVAEYAYIIGTDVWAGADRNITGPYHSNGGIRMDGTNNSLVTSALASWYCTSSFGCNPSQTVGGVFGDGPGDILWQYPESEISFTDMASDFSDMKTYAQNGGIYLEPYGTTEIQYQGYWTAVDGYHLVFLSDGTVDIYEVTDTKLVWGYQSGIGDRPHYHIIEDENFVERRTIPADCPLIFVEDKVWIEGTVKGKVTVIAADLVSGSYDPDVILRDDINYSTQVGTDGLTVIAENAVLIPPQSPDNLYLQGIFIAQGDRFGRAHYSSDKKSQLTIRGTIVSKERVGTRWTCGGSYCSGYANRDNSYDRLQTTNPPPFTPSYTTTPRYILWSEE
jgi:hypothetical protein